MGKKLKPSEISASLAQVGSAFARTPESSAAAARASDMAAAMAQEEYDKAVEEAKRKQEKLGNFMKVADWLKIIPTPFEIDDILIDTAARQFGGADESLGQSLAGSAQNALVKYAGGKLTGKAGDLAKGAFGSTAAASSAASSAASQTAQGAVVRTPELATQAIKAGGPNTFMSKAKDIAGQLATNVAAQGGASQIQGLINTPRVKQPTASFALKPEYRYKAKEMELEQQRLASQEKYQQGMLANAQEQTKVQREEITARKDMQKVDIDAQMDRLTKSITSEEKLTGQRLASQETIAKNDLEARLFMFGKQFGLDEKKFDEMVKQNKAELGLRAQGLAAEWARIKQTGDMNAATLKELDLKRTLLQTQIDAAQGKPTTTAAALEMLDRMGSQMSTRIVEDPYTGEQKAVRDGAMYSKFVTQSLLQMGASGLITDPERINAIVDAVNAQEAQQSQAAAGGGQAGYTFVPGQGVVPQTPGGPGTPGQAPTGGASAGAAMAGRAAPAGTAPTPSPGPPGGPIPLSAVAGALSPTPSAANLPSPNMPTQATASDYGKPGEPEPPKLNIHPTKRVETVMKDNTELQHVLSWDAAYPGSRFMGVEIYNPGGQRVATFTDKDMRKAGPTLFEDFFKMGYKIVGVGTGKNSWAGGK